MAKCQVAEAKRKPGEPFSTTTFDIVAGSISGPSTTTWLRLPVYSSGSNSKRSILGPTVTVAASRAARESSASR